MVLRDNFEGVRGSILHRSPLPSVDSVVHELLAEEIRLKTLSGKGILPDPNPSVLAASFWPSSNHQNNLTQELVVMNVATVRRKVIGRLSVLSWVEQTSNHIVDHYSSNNINILMGLHSLTLQQLYCNQTHLEPVTLLHPFSL